MKRLFFFLFFGSFCGYAQDTIQWNFEWKTDSLSNPIWNVDPFGNLIVSEKDKLKKFDSLGTQKFVQSNKYFGVISSIDPSNPMKTMVFSEQQQLVGYVDNTLSKQQENIELSAFDLSYVTMVSTSGQPDKFWVYDQDNSVIVLISKNVQQRQRIENISGLLGCKDIVQLFETENNLYLIDKQRGIYQFDIYGTLVFHWENVGILCAEVEGKFAYLLKSDKLQVINLSNQEIVNFPLPVGEFSIFKKVQNHFYFGTNSNIQRYSIEFLH
jgi:hypothetical protein